ncbi:MAG: hypothetical protein KAS39_01810, partial [Actinomycetia bacterium]|nr:hypothetical protein [Actinomycetes bacterium]
LKTGESSIYILSAGKKVFFINFRNIQKIDRLIFPECTIYRVINEDKNLNYIIYNKNKYLIVPFSENFLPEIRSDNKKIRSYSYSAVLKYRNGNFRFISDFELEKGKQDSIIPVKERYGNIIIYFTEETDDPERTGGITIFTGRDYRLLSYGFWKDFIYPDGIFKIEVTFQFKPYYMITDRRLEKTIIPEGGINNEKRKSQKSKKIPNKKTEYFEDDFDWLIRDKELYFYTIDKGKYY